MPTRGCSTCRKPLPEELFFRKPNGELGKTCAPCREKQAAKRRARAGAVLQPERRAPEPRVLLDAPAPGHPFGARILWADARDVLGDVERPDLIVTDPPYGIGTARRGDVDLAYAVLALAIRRLRPGGRICVFGDRRHHFDLEQAGGALVKILEPLIWDQGRRGQAEGARAWGPSWEFISVGERVADGSEADRVAARAIPERIRPDAVEETIELIIAPSPDRRRGRTRRGRADVEEILRRYRPVRLRRPSVLHRVRRGGEPDRTEKPSELLKQLISAGSRPHDLVLDPFAGGGSTGVAALELGRRFLGIEVDEQVADRAASRLRVAKCEATPALRVEEAGFMRENAGEWREPIEALRDEESEL